MRIAGNDDFRVGCDGAFESSIVGLVPFDDCDRLANFDSLRELIDID